MPLSFNLRNTSWIVALSLLATSWTNGVAGQDLHTQNEAVPVLRDLNSYFPFDVPNNLDDWNKRKSQLQKHLRMSLGLWPYPKRTPLNAVIHGAIDQGDYTVEKVYFESLPGFYVTGNLYKPKKFTGKIPGIASPHGHFPQGRFGEQNDEAIANEISSGAETFRSNAKNVIQSRCANLARMGCVVFVYDMIGYADSQQITNEVAHRFSKQRPDLNSPISWSLFSPHAELNLQNVMGLQAWNSIRVLDFLESLPEVDPNRIGVTGASGGATQTFIVCALDDRPAAAFPAVMVSTAMQGGCTCENCCYLRVGTGNVELAAMYAPKPMGLTAANDWTKEMETKGYPELQKLYELYDKKNHVELTARINFGHNYNQVSREAMYRWFKKHLNFEGQPVEAEIKFLKPEQTTVFDQEHPRPPGGEHFERNLLVGFASPKISGENYAAENNIGTFVEMVMHSAEASNGQPQPFTHSKPDSGVDGLEAVQWDFETTNVSAASSVREITRGALPRVLLISKDGFSVLEKDHSLHPFIQACLESMTVSVFNNGWISPADRIQSRRVKNPREALAYTVGYNAPQLARRSNAWRTAPQMTMTAETPVKESVYVVSLDQSALEVMLNARYLKSRNEIAGLVIRTDGFRFNEITDIRDPDLLPGAVKFHDVPGLLTLAAPEPMLLIGEDSRSARLVVRAYNAAGAKENLTLIKGIPEGRTQQDVVLEWIKKRELEKDKNP